jgi:hypothetical protein
MSRPKLTEAQSQPLLALLDLQRTGGVELEFLCTDAGAIAPESTAFGAPAGGGPPVQASQKTVRIQPDMGYAAGLTESRSVSSTANLALSLTQAAIDYGARMRKPVVVRGILDVSDAWKQDLRAALIAFVFSVLTSVVANMLMR